MGRVFSVSFSQVAVTAAQDLFSLLPASGRPVAVCALYLSQSTEAGDAAEEMLKIAVKRGAAAAGSGGSAATPRPRHPSDAAAAFTARVNDTTPASAGTAVVLHADNWNVRGPYVWMPPPDCRPLAAPATYLQVELLAAPADSVTMSGTLYVEEADA